MNEDSKNIDQPRSESVDDVPQVNPSAEAQSNSSQSESMSVYNEQSLNTQSVSSSNEATVKPSTSKQDTMANNPSLIVLQWLTYAFWGWTILVVLWLGYIVFANFITSLDLTGAIPYAIAGSLVLLPLSFVVDALFGRKETVKKTGPATIVMVIHAVIFALCGIGTLISAVFTVIQMAINGPDESGLQVSILLTLFLSTALYALTFFRTINPLPKVPIARLYKYIMAGIIGVLVVLAFIGPVAKSVQTKDDRDIANGLSYIVSGVSEYVESNNELPKSLSELNLSSEAKVIVDRGLVTYKPEGKVNSFESTNSASDYYRDTIEAIYRYQLCVTYKEAKTDSSLFGYEESNSNKYKQYVSVGNHPAGEVCYKLETQKFSSRYN